MEKQVDIYRPRSPKKCPFYQCIADHFEEFIQAYDERYEREYGFWRPVIAEVIEKYLECGDLTHGFARVRCDHCGHEYLLAFSCKGRAFCPSCHMKRVLQFYNIIGIVNVLDVLYAEKPSATISTYIRKDVCHEPESKRVHSLLRDLRHSKTTMVFVVDEYGGVVGLVTIEDLIEEILGDIWDEKDKEEDGIIRQISDNVIECDGKTEIQLINHVYNMSIPLGDYKTIAGYILSLLERIPKRGEFVQTEFLRIVVLDANSRSVRRVRIIRK